MKMRNVTKEVRELRTYFKRWTKIKFFLMFSAIMAILATGILIWLLTY